MFSGRVNSIASIANPTPTPVKSAITAITKSPAYCHHGASGGSGHSVHSDAGCCARRTAMYASAPVQNSPSSRQAAPGCDAVAPVGATALCKIMSRLLRAGRGFVEGQLFSGGLHPTPIPVLPPGALGSPFGFQSSVTSGIVSALDRETTGRLDRNNIAQYIQTDAAINPGNSGGALVNLQGEVIGLNTWIASRSGSSTGVGFALPINAARHGIRELIESGEVRYGYLGVFVSSASDEMRAALGVAEVDGALAWSVIGGSPAARGDLRPGDWVTHVNGAPVAGSSELIRSVGALEPGRNSSFTVIRGGKRLQLQVRVAVRDDARQQTARDWPGLFPVHVTNGTLTDRAREQLGIGNRRGVLVGQVNEAGAAAAAGVRQMDLITHVNGAAVRDAADFFRLLGPGDEREYEVRILRDGRGRTIILRP